jgi:hypothetical protein
LEGERRSIYLLDDPTKPNSPVQPSKTLTIRAEKKRREQQKNSPPKTNEIAITRTQKKKKKKRILRLLNCIRDMSYLFVFVVYFV